MGSPGKLLLVHVLSQLQNHTAPAPQKYIFAGFHTRQEADSSCGSGRLAAPKTAEARRSLQVSIGAAILKGSMSSTWPRNAVWLGGYLNLGKQSWEWDDGSAVNLVWAPDDKASSQEVQQQPYMYMDVDGWIHATELGFLSPWKFGVFCETDKGNITLKKDAEKKEPQQNQPCFKNNNTDARASLKDAEERADRAEASLKAEEERARVEVQAAAEAQAAALKRAEAAAEAQAAARKRAEVAEEAATKVTRFIAESATAAPLEEIVETTEAPLEPASVNESFCCTRSEAGLENPCETCQDSHRLGLTHYCGTSTSACRSCSLEAVWCGTEVNRDAEVLLSIGSKIPSDLKELSKVTVAIGSRDLPSLVLNVTQPDVLPGGIAKGSLSVQGLGKKYLAGNRGGSYGDSVILQHNSGLTILSSHRGTWSAESLTQFFLLGKSFSYTIDLSKVGCACNIAVYMISSPALDLYGKPQRGENRGYQPPFYCDANKVGGQWCPEVDIMEANNKVFAATLHKCTSRTKFGHYTDCDRRGCTVNTGSMGNTYGPGSDFTINTLKPFRVEMHFGQIMGMLADVWTILSQEDREVKLQLSECTVGDLAAISDAIQRGMSMRMSYWGDDPETMSWLDGTKCVEATHCAGASAGAGVLTRFEVRNETRNFSNSSASSAGSFSSASSASTDSNDSSNAMGLFALTSDMEEIRLQDPGAAHAGLSRNAEIAGLLGMLAAAALIVSVSTAGLWRKSRPFGRLVIPACGVDASEM